MDWESSPSRIDMIPKGPKFPQSAASSHQNKVWMNPMLAQRRAHQREKQALNNARKSVCKNSDIWHKDFDLYAHKEALAEAERKKASYKSETAHREWEQKHHYESAIGEVLPTQAPIRPAFDGKSFLDSPHPVYSNRSSVLSLETIFTPDFDESLGRELADWPPMEEMMFEGTGRVSTERIHGRFLPLPRQPGNPTVNFTLRDIIEPYALDNFTFYPCYYPQCLLEPYPMEEDVLPKHYYVPEWEFTDPITGAYDDDAVHALGTELLSLLDCRDQY